MDATYRVLVRGRFGELDERARASLLDSAADHDLLKAAFTTDGTLTYDRSLLGFAFRYEVVTAGDNAERDARDEAQLRTEATMSDAGYPVRDLRVSATSMSDIPIRRKTR